MLTKISAEFDSIETAEFAAKRIRETAGGVKRINLVSRKHITSSNRTAVSFDPYRAEYTVIPTAITSSNYVTVNTLTEPSYGHNNSNFSRGSARINITCEEEYLHKIESIMISMGGISIIKN